MKRAGLALAGAVLVTAATAPALSARDRAPVSYTQDQAWRGRLKYYQNCAECHGGNLGGVTGPALAGRDGNLQWQTGAAIWSEISVEMPDGNGGGLPVQTYVDIMAFLYQQHHKPPGNTLLDVHAIEADTSKLGW